MVAPGTWQAHAIVVGMSNQSVTSNLQHLVQTLYEPLNHELLFHGWHHIYFVTRKALEFAPELQADPLLVEAAALVHDVNYIVDKKSDVEAGAQLRNELLTQAGFSPTIIEQIESIVTEASTKNRSAAISSEAKALSDADSLYKVVPIGPIIFSSKYIAETGVDLHKWADRIVREQRPLLDQDIFFYSATAKERYLPWAKMNIEYVELIKDSLDDPDIQDLIQISKSLHII